MSTHVYGLVVFTPEVGLVTPEEMGMLVMDVGTELHLLRHYTNVSARYVVSLVGQEYEAFDPVTKTTVTKKVTASHIDSALGMRGSKFINNTFQSNPRELLGFITRRMVSEASERRLHWFDAGFARKTYFGFSAVFSVGTTNVVPLTELSEIQRAIIMRVPRGKLAGDDFLVNTLDDISLDLWTDSIAVVIGWVKDQPAPCIFTAHPGTLAPDFPRDNQGEEERAYNTKFWEEHVFVS